LKSGFHGGVGATADLGSNYGSNIRSQVGGGLSGATTVGGDVYSSRVATGERALKSGVSAGVDASSNLGTDYSSRLSGGVQSGVQGGIQGGSDYTSGAYTSATGAYTSGAAAYTSATDPSRLSYAYNTTTTGFPQVSDNITRRVEQTYNSQYVPSNVGAYGTTQISSYTTGNSADVQAAIDQIKRSYVGGDLNAGNTLKYSQTQYDTTGALGYGTGVGTGLGGGLNSQVTTTYQTYGNAGLQNLSNADAAQLLRQSGAFNQGLQSNLGVEGDVNVQVQGEYSYRAGGSQAGSMNANI